MTVNAFIYTGLSLLNQFYCDSAIIDKTLFYEIYNFNPVAFGANLEHIINLIEVKNSIYYHLPIFSIMID